MRTLLILERIQHRPGVGAAELARTMGVTTRSIRRAVDSLREAGIGVTSTPGPGGGYRVAAGARVPLLFTSEELLALVLALLEAARSNESTPETAAVRKLLSALPRTLAEQAQAVLESTTRVDSRWDVRPSAPIVLALTAAVDAAKTVEIVYRSHGADRATPRPFEAWAVVVRHGRWYVLGRSLRSGETRGYRVDRISSVRVLDAGFDPPRALDAPAELERHFQQTWLHEVTVRMHTSLETAREALPTAMGVLSDDGDHVTLQGRTNNPRLYALDLLRAGMAFTVVTGPELVLALSELEHEIRAATHARGDA